MQPDFDILVVGAGVAGTTSAILLARAGWRVMLVDPGKTIHESGESLAPQARPLLEDLGLWDTFLASAPLEIAVSRGTWGAHRFEHSGIQSPYGMGWIINKARWVRMLRRAATIHGVEVLLDSGVGAVGSSGADAQDRLIEAQLQHRSGGMRVVRAARIVDATGPRAVVAKQLGARRHLTAPLAASLWHGASSSARTGLPVIRLGTAAENWWYAAPLPAGGVAVTLYGTTLSQRRQAALARPLLDAVGTAFGIAAEWTPAPIRLSAASGHLTAAAGPLWTAVGDAACSFDPLASTGLLQALRGAARASCAIAAELSGDGKPLADYALNIRALFEQFSARRTQIYASRSLSQSYIDNDAGAAHMPVK